MVNCVIWEVGGAPRLALLRVRVQPLATQAPTPAPSMRLNSCMYTSTIIYTALPYAGYSTGALRVYNYVHIHTVSLRATCAPPRIAFYVRAWLMLSPISVKYI